MSNLQTKMAVVPDAPGAAVLAQAFCSARRTPPRWASLSAHMPMDHRQLSLATFLVCVSASFYTFAADIPRAPAYDASLRNLMVVVRETVDAASRNSDKLEYSGKVTAKLPDGRQQTFELAHYSYLGDTHIRFVFDTPKTMMNASLEEFSKFGLAPQLAVAEAIANIRRVYGPPKVEHLDGGLYRVMCERESSLSSSFFLDTAFWEQQSRSFPEGLVIALPQRDRLYFTSLGDKKAVELVSRQVSENYSRAGTTRVSSALYLFKDGRWSVYQAPSTR